MSRTAIRIAPALALLALACAINPVTGWPELVLVSAGQERKIGAAETQNVEQAMGFVADGELVAYVRRLGGRLAGHSPRHDFEHTFHVVDRPEPNAFALPGGYVFVTRGLLALANSEDELACAIAHEIGHVAARHAAARASLGVPFALVTALPAAAVGLVLPRLGQAISGVGQLASGLVLAPYSREQEREADRAGQQMAAAAGWDPVALASMLESIEREARLSQPGEDPGFQFLASHPSTAERARTVRADAGSFARGAAQPIAATHAQFLGRLEGLIVGPSAAEGVFLERDFLHPELGFALRFPEGWKTVNARSYVAAQSPDARSQVVVELAKDGATPEAAARTFAERTRLTLRQGPEATTLGGQPAQRARGEHRGLAVALWWVALGGHVYQIGGVAPAASLASYEPAINATAGSFRALAAADRARILDARLRLAPAQGGERLEALVARVRSDWSADEVAVANALERDARLEQGSLVKVARREPYHMLDAGQKESR
jgi:predicted Zn-dependent protease